MAVKEVLLEKVSNRIVIFIDEIDSVLGLAFSVVGLLTVLLSTQHYFAVRYDIDEDTYEPPDRWVLISSLTILLLGAGVIYYLFSIPFSTPTNVVVE